MKTTFKKSEINHGCYESDHEEVLRLPHTFDINYVLDLNIPLKDKFWFVRNNCEFSTKQYREMAIGVAKIVLPIYEKKHPDNRAPREAIQSAQDYLNGIIGIDSLLEKRNAAAAAAAYAADADAAAAYAAYAAYAAAYAASYAAAYAAAVDADAYAVDAAAWSADAYTQRLLDYLKNFIDEN